MTFVENPDANFRFGPDAIDRHVKASRRFGLAGAGEHRAHCLAELNRIQARSHVHGAVCEIGIAAYETFGLLFLATRNTERALAIEIAGQDRILSQHTEKAETALKRLKTIIRQSATDCTDIDMICRRIMDLEPDLILDAIGPVRFLSINDYLSERDIEHSLAVAELVLSGGGVVLVQGFFEAKRPGVACGVSRYLLQRETRLEPFLVTGNDLWLTSPQFGLYYQPRLRRALWARHSGETTFFDFPIDVYGPNIYVRRLVAGRLQGIGKELRPKALLKRLRTLADALPKSAGLMRLLLRRRAFDHAAQLLHRLGGAPDAPRRLPPPKHSDS